MLFTGCWKGIHRKAEPEQELLNCRCWQGDLDRARELVEIERVNVECVDSECGRTPLMMATSNQHTQVVQMLLENGANVDVVNEFEETPLVVAINDDNVALVQILLEHGSEVNGISWCKRTSGNHSPLGLAIVKRRVGIVALLLRFDANTQETLYDGKSYSALYLAYRLAYMEVVQMMLEHYGGAVVNAYSPREDDYPAMSPLCQACINNSMEMAQLFVRHGAQVIFDGVYPNVPSPLVHAVEKGSLDLVQFLVDNARLPDMQETPNHPLSPALEIAIQCNKLDAARLLVDSGANVNDRSFLWQCARHGLPDMARLLLRVGANVNLAHGTSGETPLWAAAERGHEGLVKEFLKARANVRIRDQNGETPLGVAHHRGHKGIVYLLLRTSPHVWPKLERSLCSRILAPGAHPH